MRDDPTPCTELHRRKVPGLNPRSGLEHEEVLPSPPGRGLQPDPVPDGQMHPAGPRQG